MCSEKLRDVAPATHDLQIIGRELIRRIPSLRELVGGQIVAADCGLTGDLLARIQRPEDSVVKLTKGPGPGSEGKDPQMFTFSSIRQRPCKAVRQVKFDYRPSFVRG
jgi:hypothetical protein